MKKLLAILLSLLMLAAASAETAAVNPWTETTPDAIMQTLGFTFTVPEGAENIACRMLESEALAEMCFSLGDADFTARIRSAAEFEDISGLHCEWLSDDPAAIGWCEGRLMRADEDALCLWFDAAPGLMYSLHAHAAGETDLPAIAERVYFPAQGEADALTADGLLSVLERCMGYEGTAGSSLKEANAACALADYALAVRAAECDLSAVDEALAQLGDGQCSDLARHLQGIRALLKDVFSDFDPLRGLFDDAGCLGQMESVLFSETAQAHCEALIDRLP